MAERVIDYDRGVLIRNHPGTGMDVYMYVDEPGRYLTAHGKDVAKNLAEESGYDVEKLEKERLRRERKVAASAIIDQELADDKDVLENVVAEREGWKIISFGFGRHNVLDPDGNVLNASPLSVEVASRLFNSMAPEQIAEVKEDNAGGKNKNK